MESKFFTYAKPLLTYIDEGHLFRRPFNGLYMLMAIINLIIPISIFVIAVKHGIFKLPFKFGLVFILLWLIIAFASWIGFQIWWDRKTQVLQTTTKGDDIIAIPVFSHFIQTIGEWIGVWIGMVGFGFALLTTIFLSGDSYELSYAIGINFLGTGFLSIILMPLTGFMIIVVARFLAEQFRVLAAIANNTKPK